MRQSALRERKRSKSNLKRRSKTQEVSSPGSAAEQTQKYASEIQLSAEKSGSGTVKANNFNRAKQFSPVVFYGSPNGVPPKKPSRSLLRLLREIRVDLATQKRLSSRKEVWATFPRQDEAMQFAKGNGNVHVFSYQDHYSGQRRYNNMNPKFRHHYEGLPCHLYFDLEFNKRDNAGRNGDEMVDVLISVIFEALLEKYSIQGNQEWILELDSSTEAKFSRHLIIRIEKTAFKDNSHVGAFVTEICSRISSAKERDGRFGNFFVRKDSKSSNFASQLFVDTAVYTRNRCFRLALSSKAGKNSVLLPTGRFKAMDMQSEEEMFMASLICNLDVDCEKLLVCKTDLDCIKTLHFDTEVNRNFGKCYSWPQEFALNGKIRSWYWFSEFGHMVYSMSRNRYCERIGRQHKSNHGYRSPSRPIPLDIIPEMVHEYRNDHECVPYGDQNMTSSCITDSWWLEAIRVADDVENKKIDISNMLWPGLSTDTYNVEI
ncbi:DNA primase [Prunus dulcis]|uniref:DNA-directed primase/polymerase protein n=1 Tax=Prunus dulcis TaxID=3755 RepID=A0A4Y1R2J2_PRUDU|nr:DNA primase [Prunus dulcis]